ncbi:LOW QUALITY PROTEIN: hypothetical protein MAR_022170 [Mya arenaria]|uniref:Uncharacterized protein n=1 Tax=Mya arenaria TaxID=6604 RepID=A0ABY7DJB7_MYAAR|nr:LOW QUALITY PROTEIN: hypothetical protein MAR_022170 [Mya arenaria]
MTDETSKAGNKYMEARDTDGKLWVLGLREICTKSSHDTLYVFKEILDDIDYIGETANSEKSKQIMKHIVATMSDRAATETKFNRLLNEYRNSVLPLIREVYNDLDENESRTVSAFSIFFCGLHSLVHIAETSNKSLLNAEKGIFGENNVPTPDHGSFKHVTESGTTRLLPKLFLLKGMKSRAAIRGFLENKLHSLPLKQFRGSRFNILFPMRQKPRITTVASGTYIMFANNKTMDWLKSKDQKEKDHITARARKEGRQLLQRFRLRKVLIMQQQRQALEESLRKKTEAKLNKNKKLE